MVGIAAGVRFDDSHRRGDRRVRVDLDTDASHSEPVLNVFQHESGRAADVHDASYRQRIAANRAYYVIGITQPAMDASKFPDRHARSPDQADRGCQEPH